MNYDPGPIPAFLDRTKLVYSFTNLNTYENVCPHQFQHRYILKDIPFEKTAAMEYGNKVHEAMEHRVRGTRPLAPDFLHWEPFAKPYDAINHLVSCELKLGIDEKGNTCGFFDSNVWLRGKADVAVINGEKAVLTDWKTGQGKFENRFELDVQALMLHAKHPRLKKITGHYVWLRENRVGQQYDLSDTRQAWTKVTGIVKKIESDRHSGKFEKRQGPLCGWCDVMTCEHNRKGK